MILGPFRLDLAARLAVGNGLGGRGPAEDRGGGGGFERLSFGGRRGFLHRFLRRFPHRFFRFYHRHRLYFLSRFFAPRG